MAQYKLTKKWMVESWTHAPSGTKLAVYYNKDSKKFWAPVAHKLVEDATQTGARQKADELADTLLTSEDRWYRIIIVSTDNSQRRTRYGGYRSGESHNSPRVGFDCWRTWVLDGEDGERYSRHWDRNPEHAMRKDIQKRFADVRRFSSYSDDGVELPYSDELWEALMSLSQRLGTINEELGRIVKSEDFAEILVSELLPRIAGKLLGEGK